MTHPFKSQSKTGQQMAKARYADGGNVQVAGDIEPLRPFGHPANTAAQQNQIKNQQRQRPDTSDPNNNIHGLYGHMTVKG